MASIKLKDSIERDTKAIECSNCSGFCEKVEPTPKERIGVGCGRPDCCNASFKCKVCGQRFYATLYAPEME